jgi:hypothetical protein
VDKLVSGVALFIGEIDAATGLCQYTISSGHANGPLIPAASAPNQYVICEVPGTIPSGPAAGITMVVGDWLISDGVNWIHLAVGGITATAGNISVAPPVLGQNNVQGALEAIEVELGNKGDTMTGMLVLAADPVAAM